MTRREPKKNKPMRKKCNGRNVLQGRKKQIGMA
jgi:hypothetical protein